MKKVRYPPPPQIVFVGMKMERSPNCGFVQGHSDGRRLALVVDWLRRETSWLGRRKPKQRFADQSDEEDVLQDAVVRALEEFPLLRLETGRVGPWLSATARHLQIDGQRKVRRQEVHLCRDSGQTEGIAAPEREAESKLILREEGRRTVEAANALPLKLRAVFFMFHRDELSHVEIGAKLGISEDASKMRLHRAHEILRKQLGPETGDMLNSLRCRLPPLFFMQNGDVSNGSVDRKQKARRVFEVMRFGATASAALLAASLAGTRFETPKAWTGLRVPDIHFALAVSVQPASSESINMTQIEPISASSGAPRNTSRGHATRRREAAQEVIHGDSFNEEIPEQTHVLNVH